MLDLDQVCCLVGPGLGPNLVMLHVACFMCCWFVLLLFLCVVVFKGAWFVVY